MFRCTRAEIDDALAASCKMMLSSLTLTPTGCEIRTTKDLFVLRVLQRGRVIELVFPKAIRRSGKGALLLKLIAKQLEPVIPRLRVNLRRRR